LFFPPDCVETKHNWTGAKRQRIKGFELISFIEDELLEMQNKENHSFIVILGAILPNDDFLSS